MGEGVSREHERVAKRTEGRVCMNLKQFPSYHLFRVHTLKG